MNLLIDLVPTEVEIDKKVYEINSDFRTSLLFEQLMLDDEVNDEFKWIQAIELYYPIIPENLEEAFNKIFWFYSCGKDEEKSSNSEVKNTSFKPIYDWDYDDEYIYSAFLEQFRIDLQEIEYLHWWKFKAMFKSLNSNVKFSEILKYRSVDLSKIQDKEERKFYKEMKDRFKLPQKINKAELEKKNEIEELLLKGKMISSEVLSQ